MIRNKKNRCNFCGKTIELSEEVALLQENIAIPLINSGFRYNKKVKPIKDPLGSYRWKACMSCFTEMKDQVVQIKKQESLKYGSFTDRRKNKNYKTIKIGDQVWMAENLAYKPIHIMFATNKGNKYYSIKPYGMKESNIEENGYLYDYYSAKAVCPDGWHLPTVEEFQVLLKNTGGEGFEAFRALRSGGYSGFNATFSGFYVSDRYSNLGDSGGYWTSSQKDFKSKYSENYATGVFFYGKRKKVLVNSLCNINWGLSVRCIKD